MTLKLPPNCTQSLPYFENNEFIDEGGFICRVDTGEVECRVLYTQVIVPTKTKDPHEGWSGNKRRYVPVQILGECS